MRWHFLGGMNPVWIGLRKEGRNILCKLATYDVEIYTPHMPKLGLNNKKIQPNAIKIAQLGKKLGICWNFSLAGKALLAYAVTTERDISIQLLSIDRF